VASRDCPACGGTGWLPSRPEGDSECPYCKGTGKSCSDGLGRKVKEEKKPKEFFQGSLFPNIVPPEKVDP